MATGKEKICGFLKKGKQEFSGGLGVKDLGLTLPWLGFNSWPGNCDTLQEQPKKKKKKSGEEIKIER